MLQLIMVMGPGVNQNYTTKFWLKVANLPCLGTNPYVHVWSCSCQLKYMYIPLSIPIKLMKLLAVPDYNEKLLPCTPNLLHDLLLFEHYNKVQIFWILYLNNLPTNSVLKFIYLFFWTVLCFNLYAEYLRIIFSIIL